MAASRRVELAGLVLVAAVAASVKIALANSLLLVAVVLWLTALWRGEVRWRRTALYLPVGAYLVSSLAAVAFSLDPRHSLAEVGELLTLAVVPVAVAVIDQRRFQWLLAALAAVAAGSAGLGLWQYLHGASTLANRLHGLNNHYMTFSGWILLVTLLLVGDAAFNCNRRRLLWTLPVVALCTVALALSYTRSAWVGLAAGLVLAAAVWRPRLVVVLPVVVVAATLLLPPGVLERAVSIVDVRHPSNYDRLCMILSGLEMVEDHPLFGVGLGMVERRYPVYREDDAPRWRVPHLHNNLLQLAAERGLIGLACYAAILVAFAVKVAAAWRGAGRGIRPALAGCALAVAGVTVAGLFEYNWGDAEVWIPTLTLLAAPFALAPEAR